MVEVVAVVSPVWLLVAGVAGLFVVAFLLGRAACFAIGIRRRLAEYEAHAAYAPDVAREFRRIEGRLDEHLELEHSGPLSVRTPRPIRA